MAVVMKDVIMAILQIAGGRPRRAAQLPRGQPLGAFSSRVRARMPGVPPGTHGHLHSRRAVHGCNGSIACATREGVRTRSTEKPAILRPCTSMAKFGQAMSRAARAG